MKKYLSNKTAYITYLSITAFALLYHFLIITQIVDSSNAWGGRLESVEQMYQFEIFSVILILIFTLVVQLKYKSESKTKVYQISKYLLYVISAIYLLNTFGNLSAIQLFEKVVFTPITLIASIVTFRIAIE